MTQKSAKRLQTKQAIKGANSMLELINQKKARPNPTLLRMLLKESDLIGARVDLMAEALSKEAKRNLKLFVNISKLADEKLNPNKLSRKIAIYTLAKLAFEGDARTIRRLTLALRDSETTNRIFAIGGLKFLATKGNRRTFEGLKFALQDNSQVVSLDAIRGIFELAKNGDKRTMDILSKLSLSNNPSIREKATELFAKLKSVKE
jgi:hypothetical protein